MKRLLCLIALLVGVQAMAEEPAAKKKKKAPAKKEQLTHKKPTPEQIRRFNELQKKG